VVYLPQRFQAVNDLSPVTAGIRICPALVVSAFAATATGFVLSKKNICSYMMIAGTALQLLGLGLQSSLPTSAAVPPAAYGYQAVLGLGLGTSLIASFVLARIEVRREDIGKLTPSIALLHQPSNPSKPSAHSRNDHPSASLRRCDRPGDLPSHPTILPSTTPPSDRNTRRHGNHRLLHSSHQPLGSGDSRQRPSSLRRSVQYAMAYLGLHRCCKLVDCVVLVAAASKTD